MKLPVSLCDSPVGANERILVSMLKALGCGVDKQPYKAAANKYQCSKWAPAILNKIKHLGWELDFTSHGQLHFAHSDNEICVITVTGNNFDLEFPEI